MNRVISTSLCALIITLPMQAGIRDSAIRAIPKIGIGLSAITPVGVAIYKEYRYQKSRSLVQKQPVDHNATAWATKVLTESNALSPDFPLMVKTHENNADKNTWDGYETSLHIHKNPGTDTGIPAKSQLKHVYHALKNKHPQKDRIAWPIALIVPWALITDTLYRSFNKTPSLIGAFMQCAVLATVPTIVSMPIGFAVINGYRISLTQQSDTFLIEHAKNSEELFTIAKALEKKPEYRERAHYFYTAAARLAAKEPQPLRSTQTTHHKNEMRFMKKFLQR